MGPDSSKPQNVHLPQTVTYLRQMLQNSSDALPLTLKHQIDCLKDIDSIPKRIPKRIMKSQFIATAVSALVASDTPTTCCKAACKAPLAKYYSIDKSLCGETCIDPKRYNLLHIFEKGLTASVSSISPCADKGYTVYVNSPTHGGFGIAVTVDLYKKP
jgi:hypothetical protein